MAKKLTAQQIDNRNSFLHDIFAIAGTAPSKKPINWLNNAAWCKQPAEALVMLIKVRPTTFQDFRDGDQVLSRLSNRYFSNNMSSPTKWIHKPAAMLANYVASFCADQNLYWDDSLLTDYEKNEIRRTELGSALAAFNCFVSQADAPAKSTGGTRSSGSAPANNYKASGGQSANIINLVGTPGQKSHVNGYVYDIEADKINTNVPNAFVKPLNDKANKSGANEIFFGSGNGYTDCRCWFDNYQSALTAAQHIQNKFGSKYTNIKVHSARPDSNGYFIVKTELGINCLIKASKMNEALISESNTCFRPAKLDAIQESNDGIKMTDIDDFSETIIKELA